MEIFQNYRLSISSLSLFLAGQLTAEFPENAEKMNNRTQENNTDVQIEEFNADTIHQLSYASEYIKALTQHGIAAYIDNAHVEMKALLIDDIILPIVISNQKHGNADACSPYLHYVKYTLEELIKRNQKMPKWLFKC